MHTEELKSPPGLSPVSIAGCGSSAATSKGGRSGIKTSANHLAKAKVVKSRILKVAKSDTEDPEAEHTAAQSLLAVFWEADTKTEETMDECNMELMSEEEMKHLLKPFWLKAYRCQAQ